MGRSMSEDLVALCVAAGVPAERVQAGIVTDREFRELVEAIAWCSWSGPAIAMATLTELLARLQLAPGEEG